MSKTPYVKFLEFLSEFTLEGKDLIEEFKKDNRKTVPNLIFSPRTCISRSNSSVLDIYLIWTKCDNRFWEALYYYASSSTTNKEPYLNLLKESYNIVHNAKK